MSEYWLTTGQMIGQLKVGEIAEGNTHWEVRKLEDGRIVELNSGETFKIDKSFLEELWRFQPRRKHTPGPWILGKTTDSVITLGEQCNDPSLIEWYGGNVVAESISSEEDRYLIMAAPDLQEACQKAYEALEAITGFCGQNLQVYGWHLNGDPESFDNFIEENMDGNELELLIKAMSKARGE